jgi:hypothetical protein
MKLKIVLLAIAVSIVMLTGAAQAQELLEGLPVGSLGSLLPKNPNSVDNIRLNLYDQTCGGGLRYTGNPYRVSMAQNNITVNLGEQASNPFGLCPPGPREEIDLGRLPAGNYTLTLISSGGKYGPGTIVDKFPFVVTDARATKAAPYVRLDYSGTWWDPNDSGWGLFIWQDAKQPVDVLLAAWFTFAADGKPVWYTFQPQWASVSTTTEAALLQSNRLPATGNPPPNPPLGPNTFTQAGTASLDFATFGAGDEGKLTYAIGTGAKIVRTIKRFKP